MEGEERGLPALPLDPSHYILDKGLTPASPVIGFLRLRCS